MKRLRFVPLLLGSLILSCASESAREVVLESPADVLVAMKERHAGSWYETMTFVQTVVQHNLDGSTDTTSWFEAMQLPGKLRIDIGDPASGDSWIFRNDSIYVFSQGSLSVGQPTFHPLLLLGFDVYFLETVSVINKLDSLGFDLSVMDDTTWQEREVYVIGAERGDMDSQQFWIDKERLVFVRLIQLVGPDGSSKQDVQFNRYEPLGTGWVAPEVIFYVDGKLQLEEYYHTMSESVELDERFFSPTKWAEAKHWFSR